MDATPGSKNVNTPSLPQVAEEPPTSSSQQPGASAAGAGSAETTRRADEVDDEQVERFYALLANIRAIRGVIGTTATAAGKRKRRGRGDEPPWRPAFRIEDFETEEISSGGAASAERRKPKKRVCSSRRMQPRSETGSIVVAVNDGDGDSAAQVCVDHLDAL